MTDKENTEAKPLDSSEIPEEARKKKEILDKVESSDKPVKTILKELGISRSTFYHWRKRYDEEGIEGLMDLRTGPKEPAEEPEPEPAPAAPEPVVAEEPAEKEVEEVAPEPEKEAPKPEAAPPGPPPGGGAMEEKKGLGLYYLIAGTLLVVGLLVAVSLANSSRHFFKLEDGKIVLYRGKFAPSGTVKADDFEPIDAGDLDLGPVLSKKFYGRVAAETGLYNYFITTAANEFKKEDGANLERARSLLTLAEKLAERGLIKGSAVESRAKLFLALQKVEYAERLLYKTYSEAESVLSDALKNGSNYDDEFINEKLARIRAYLAPYKKAAEEEAAAKEPEVKEEAPAAKTEEPAAAEVAAQAVEKAEPAAEEAVEEAAAEPEAPAEAETKIEAKPEAEAAAEPATEAEPEEKPAS